MQGSSHTATCTGLEEVHGEVSSKNLGGVEKVKCYKCGGFVGKVKKDVYAEGRGNRFVFPDVKLWMCQSCGEEIYDSDELNIRVYKKETITELNDLSALMFRVIEKGIVVMFSKVRDGYYSLHFRNCEKSLKLMYHEEEKLIIQHADEEHPIIEFDDIDKVVGYVFSELSRDA